MSLVPLPPSPRHSMIRWITAWCCLGALSLSTNVALGHSHHERANHRRAHGSRRSTIDLLEERLLEDNFHPVLPPGQAPADPNKPFGKIESSERTSSSLSMFKFSVSLVESCLGVLKHTGIPRRLLSISVGIENSWFESHVMRFVVPFIAVSSLLSNLLKAFTAV